jgi:hypothetical protein
LNKYRLLYFLGGFGFKTAAGKVLPLKSNQSGNLKAKLLKHFLQIFGVVHPYFTVAAICAAITRDRDWFE